MRDWRTEPLERIAEIRSSNVDKKTNPGEEPVRLCNYMDVYSREYITENIEFMEATATPAEIQRFGIERGDVMITKDSETPDDIGIPAVVVDGIPKLVCGYHVALIKPNRTEVDSIYLAKQLGLSDTARYYGQLANGSTRYGLSYQSIARTPIRLAPLPQQQRIAEILSTVDEVIEQTEALIAKTQRIKAGLMHDLFTRGLTADGQLRPPREEAPQLYKESPLGWIPKEWEVRQLAHVYAEPARNGLYKPAAFHGRGPYMVQMGNIFRGLAVDFEGAGRVEVTATELTTYGLREGDLLFGRRSLVMEGAGKCALVDKLHEPSTFESSIIRVRLDRSRIAAEFAALFLSSEAAYRDRRRFIRQVAVSGVSGADVKQFSMILPSPEEQATICASIRAASHQIESAQREARKLAMLKCGLMRDLLTGRVPVSIESAPELKEVAANV